MKSLYVHVPFCAQKCFYCDFNSYAGLQGLIPKYFEAMQRELDFYLQKGETLSFLTVYFGGGTPSFVPSKYIKSILKIVKCDGEVTLELNPRNDFKRKTRRL